MRKYITFCTLNSTGTERTDVAPLEHLQPGSEREAAELALFSAPVTEKSEK